MGKGPEPWPLWREAEALEHGRGQWACEAEGEKCADWFAAAGFAGISQPGHDHTAASIEARYRRLVEHGVAGVMYLADRDATGERKRDACAMAASAAGLPFIGVDAADVWPEIGKGGSIDDAPGSAAERVEAVLRVAAKRHGEESARASGKTGKLDLDTAAYSQLLDAILNAIRSRNEDREMLARAQLKNRYRMSDDQINTALFKRYSGSKVKRIEQQHDGVLLSDVKPLDYLLDGWIPSGDVALTYGPFGTGKTTLAVYKAYCRAQGRNILDRSAPCAKSKSLIIATDSGAAALKKSLLDLGIDPDTDPVFQPGPQQMIWIWAHEPNQGHEAWICDIHGVIQLEQFIQTNGITYVAVDSAKSVSSAAGWSYTSNEAVKALLKYLREGICQPLGCCIEFLSHDGSEKGAHSGAKAWAEDPSMVCSLTLIKDEHSGAESVTAKFLKDRAAVFDQRRSVTYTLVDHELVLSDKAEVVGTCEEAIVEVLWTAHQNDVEALSTKAVMDEVWARFKKSRSTVENTLPRIAGSGKGSNPTPVIRPRRGHYRLSPLEVQKRSSPYRGVGEMGGVKGKSIGAQGICQPPSQPPDGGNGGNANPRQTPSGGTVGGAHIPVTPTDLTFNPPSGGGYPPAGEPPTLNGHGAAVWAVIWSAEDGEAAHTLSLRIEAETGVRMNGAQVKALVAQGPPPELQHLEPF